VILSNIILVRHGITIPGVEYADDPGIKPGQDDLILETTRAINAITRDGTRVLLVSPRKRAWETTQIMVRELGISLGVELLLADTSTDVDAIRKMLTQYYIFDHVICVTHRPTAELIWQTYVGRPEYEHLQLDPCKAIMVKTLIPKYEKRL